MKYLIFFTPLLLFSCSDKKKLPTVLRGTACNLENPYNYGTGDHAGFDWAKKKGVRTCRGVPSTYLSGCEGYISALRQCPQ